MKPTQRILAEDDCSGTVVIECRTTVFLTDSMDENLDALALITGIDKAEHVQRAIAIYIDKMFAQSKTLRSVH